MGRGLCLHFFNELLGDLMFPFIIDAQVVDDLVKHFYGGVEAH